MKSGMLGTRLFVVGRKPPQNPNRFDIQGLPIPDYDPAKETDYIIQDGGLKTSTRFSRERLGLFRLKEQESGKYVPARGFRRRLKSRRKQFLSARFADCILENPEELFPKELRVKDGGLLVFWGTIYASRHPRCHRKFVRALRYDHDLDKVTSTYIFLHSDVFPFYYSAVWQ